MSAVSCSPFESVEPVDHSDETPARNPCERLSKMGTIRVSSSSLGNAFAVSCNESVVIEENPRSRACLPREPFPDSSEILGR